MLEADNSNVKISSVRGGVGVRQKIRAFSRKISTMERKDIDPQILKKLATIFVGFFIVCYSIQIFVHLLSLLYPSFQTTKAIQNESKTGKSRWLRYWIVFSFLTMSESLLFPLTWLLPLYSLVKTVFLLWCMAPLHSNGADTIFYLVNSFSRSRKSQ